MRGKRLMLEIFKLAFAAAWGVIAAGLSFLLLLGSWDWFQECLSRRRLLLRTQRQEQHSRKEPGQ